VVFATVLFVVAPVPAAAEAVACVVVGAELVVLAACPLVAEELLQAVAPIRVTAQAVAHSNALTEARL